MTSKVIIAFVKLRSERAKKISSKNWVQVFHSSQSKNWLLDIHEERLRGKTKRLEFFLFKIVKEQVLEHRNRVQATHIQMVVEHAKEENEYSINIKELSMSDGAL